jgi:putative membrane protein
MSGERAGSWARDHLANERTLLAWVRTSIAFMGFGVAIAKLSVLLQVDAIEHPEIASQLPSASVSQFVGGALVALGGVLSFVGALQARKWAREVAGDPPNAHALILTVGLTIVTSLGLLVYLLAGARG